MMFAKAKGADYSQAIWKIIKNEVKEENKALMKEDEDDE